MKEYKRMLIDTIYKELVKKSYDVNKNSSLYIGEIYNHNGISTFNNWISTSKLNEDSIFNI
jgi:predicted transposase YbfD/YdcC